MIMMVGCLLLLLLLLNSKLNVGIETTTRTTMKNINR